MVFDIIIRTVPKQIKIDPTIILRICIKTDGINVFNKENIKTEVPRKLRVAKPADNPKGNNSLRVNEYSIDLFVKILVQKIMVKGLEIVRMNVLAKH